MRRSSVRVLVGLTVLACVLTAFVFWLIPRGYRDAPNRDSETLARVTRTAVQQWQAVHNEASCPSIAQLVAEKQLDPGQPTTDSWNHELRLTCTADDVIVTSAGKDGTFGSVDDVVVPRRGAP